MPETDDQALVLAAQGGDIEALDTLLRRHHDRIHAICRRMTGNEADALDATQDALIAVTRGIDRFDGRARFGTWVYRVTTNACLDELRRRKRRPVPVDEDHGLDEGDGRGPAPPMATSVTDRMVIDDALQEIAPEFRACVVLRDLCDLDYAEIAEVLDLRPGTVRSRIARGRAALAHVLAGEAPGAPTGGRNQPAPGDVQEGGDR